MADRVEVLIAGDSSGLVRATDKASSAMQDFGRTTSGLSRVADAFRSDFARLTAAFGAAQLGVSAVVGAFESAGRAVQAMNAEVIDAERVASKLIAVFDGAEGAAARLTAQAEALAGSTVFFDDDAIKAAAAALRAFDLAEHEIGKLLPAAVNLATVFGTDLETAANKLALGLNGSTRGLREFGIVVKEGSDRGEIMAQILERGEKAAKGAADAQGGLRGATEGLKKAQAEFNQALGNLLSGPQSAFLQFLTDATNGATNLANKMTGAAESLIKTAKVIDPLTGKIVEATGIGGRDLFGPRSLTAQFTKGVAPVAAAAKPAASKPAAVAPRPSGNAATVPTVQGYGPGLELGPGVNVFKSAGAQVVAAENKAADIRAKAAKEAADAELAAAIEGDKRAIDTANEMTRIRLEAADAEAQLLEDAAKTFANVMLSAAEKTAGLVGKAISGQSLQAQDFVGLGTMVASAIFPAFGPLIAIIGTLVSGLASGKPQEVQQKETTLEQDKARLEQLRREKRESRLPEQTELFLTGAIFTGAKSRSEQIFNLEKQIQEKEQRHAEEMQAKERRHAEETQEKERLTAQMNAETARINEEAAKELSRKGIEKAIDQFKPLSAKVANQFSDLVRPLTETTEDQQKAMMTSEKIRTMTREQLQALGGRARKAIETGDFSSIQKQFSGLGEDAFRALIASLAAVPEAGAAGPEIGDTPRNPLYVFDVTPSKDEFTRAPRGLFFRPVGSGRGVDAGQAVSGVSANTSNRAAIGRTNPNRRPA